MRYVNNRCPQCKEWFETMVTKEEELLFTAKELEYCVKHRAQTKELRLRGIASTINPKPTNSSEYQLGNSTVLRQYSPSEIEAVAQAGWQLATAICIADSSSSDSSSGSD